MLKLFFNSKRALDREKEDDNFQEAFFVLDKLLLESLKGLRRLRTTLFIAFYKLYIKIKK